MKKILSFVLVLAMVLGSVAFVSAADLTDLEGKPYETAATVLADLGVINGYSDKTFKGENSINRAEFVTMIIQALGFNPQKGGASKFSDVDPNKWYGPYVAYAADLGIVYGKTATTFGPTDPVTLDQAIAFTTRALGYYDESVIKSVNRALGLGILDGVKTGGVPATRGEVAQIIYNACALEIGTVDKNGAWTPNNATGTPVTDTFFTRCGAGPIAPMLIDLDAPALGTSKINLVPYVGKWATPIANAQGVILGITEVETQTLTGVYSAANKFTVGSTTYDITGPVAGLTQFVNAKQGAAVALGIGTPYTIEARVNGKNIAAIESVVTWNRTGAIFTEPTGTAIPAFLKSATGAAPAAWAKDANGEIDHNAFIIKGVADFSEVNPWTAVIYYYADADNDIRKIEVGQEFIVGTASKLSSDGGALTVDGKTYTVIDVAPANSKTTYQATPNLVVGQQIQMLFDYNGRVAWYAPVGAAAAAINYGLLVDKYVPASALAGDTKIQIKTAENTLKLFKPAAANRAAVDAAVAGLGNLTLVQYTMNDDGDITGIAAAGLATTTATAAGKVVTASGSIDGSYLADNVFVVKDTTLAAGDNFNKVFAAAGNVSFGGKADLPAGTYIAGYITSATTGKITAVLVRSVVAAANVVYGVYNGYGTEHVGSTNLISSAFLVNGVATTYYSAAVTTADADPAPKGLYQITINSDGTIAPATVLITNGLALGGGINAAVATVAAAGGLAATSDANVYKAGATFYNLKSPLVYSYSAATGYKVSDMPTVAALNATTAVTFYDITGDGLYDVVIAR